MFTPLEIVGDTAFRTTDQKVRGSNPFERATFFQGSDSTSSDRAPAQNSPAARARQLRLAT